MPTEPFRYSHLNLWLFSNVYERFLGFVGKVFPTYSFDFDLPFPFKHAEEGVILTGPSARMFE